MSLLDCMSLVDILSGKTLVPLFERDFRKISNDIHKAFYEKTTPPIDAYEIDKGNIQIKADMGGFVTSDVKKVAIVYKTILRIQAKRDELGDSIKVGGSTKDIHHIVTHRPLEIDAYIPLPIMLAKDEKLEVIDKGQDKWDIKNGVLTINISKN